MVRLQKQSFKTNLSPGWQVRRAYWTLSSWNWKRRKELFPSFLIKLFAIKDLLRLGFPNQLFVWLIFICYIQNGPHNLLLIQFSHSRDTYVSGLDVIFIPEVVRYYSRRKWRWMGGSISRLKARPIWLCRRYLYFTLFPLYPLYNHNQYCCIIAQRYGRLKRSLPSRQRLDNTFLYQAKSD